MMLAQWLDSLAMEATPAISECIDHLGSTADWLYRLEETPQDPEWHAEGNVLIHTGMVLDEVYKQLATEASHIQGWQRQALILGAVFHDIAKPVCTRTTEIDGRLRVASPRHAVTGRSYMAFRILELPLSFQVAWTVLNLVGEHHEPKRLVRNNKPAAAYCTLARQVSLELVFWLETADMRGRICPDLKEQLSQLEEFKLFAQEYGLWDDSLSVRNALQPHLESVPAKVRDYVYAHAVHWLESEQIALPEEALGKAYQHRENHPHVIIMCGPSGSGKSHWIQQHYGHYDVVSLDVLRESFNGNRANQNN